MMRAEAERQADMSLPMWRPRTGTQSRAIMQMVSRSLGVSMAQIMGGGRYLEFVHARACIAMVLRAKGMSLCQIGSRLGRHHTTVLHYCDHFGTYERDRPELRLLVDVLSRDRPFDDAAKALQALKPHIDEMLACRPVRRASA